MHLEQYREPDEGLVRSITAVGLAASIVNVVVGGGIFVLPAAVAAEAGAAAPAVYLIGGCAELLVAAAFVVLGRVVWRSGGAYAYVGAILGPFAGYLVGLFTWLVGAFASAALLVGLAEMVATLHPLLQTPLARAALIIALYVMPVVVNLARLRTGTSLVVALTTIKLGTLLLFLVFASPMIQVGNLTWPESLRVSELARGAIITFFAFGGLEMALGPSGEIRSPGQTLPLGVASGVVLIVLLYIAIQMTAQGVLGPALPTSVAPLADAAARSGAGLRTLILAGTAVSIAGALVGTLLGAARMLFALARAGVLPRTVGSVHPRSRIPYVAVLVHAVVAAVLALTGTFLKLAILASVSVAFVYLSTCIAAWLMAHRSRRAGETPYSFRGSTQFMSGLGAALLVALLTQMSRAEWMAMAFTMGAASLLYAFRRGPLSSWRFWGEGR